MDACGTPHEVAGHDHGHWKVGVLIDVFMWLQSISLGPLGNVKHTAYCSVLAISNLILGVFTGMPVRVWVWMLVHR